MCCSRRFLHIFNSRPTCPTRTEIIRRTMHTATNKSAIAESGIANLFGTRDDACPSRRGIDFFYFVGRLPSGSLFLSLPLTFLSYLRRPINLLYTLALFLLQEQRLQGIKKRYLTCEIFRNGQISYIQYD